MPGAMPQNHARELRESRPMSKRTRWTLGLSTGLIIVAAVVAVLLTTGSTTRRGCVETYLPGVIGAQGFNECGTAARHTCATVEGATQYGTVGVLIVEKACRAGQLPVG
jgi:hypothetical protein